MGCLNSNQGFSHWFGNIHLSGPCNRACYFCIGQHMMALDALNNLDTWPLKGLDDFIEECKKHDISEINVTGTNTDPLLYQHTRKLKEYLLEAIPTLRLGIRTNGVLAMNRPSIMQQYDKGSITICSTNHEVYRQMMGKGAPPDLQSIIKRYPSIASRGWKVNIVLGPENANFEDRVPDVFQTLLRLQALGIKRVNLREPYGQPHVGDPLAKMGWNPCQHSSLGMPHYHPYTSSGHEDFEVWYWDVHYVEVESVNLYATGRVSTLYPITAGYDDSGKVIEQSKWTHGRHVQQWQNK